MRLDDAKTMVLKSFLCLFKHGSYHRKTVSLTYEVFDISWPLTPKRLILVKYDGMVTKERLKNFLVLFLNFVTASTGTEIMIIWSHVMKIGNFGKFCLWWPLVTSMLITRKMVLVLSLELVKTYRVIFFHLSLRCLVLELVAGNICAPPPRPCAGGSDPRPCAGGSDPRPCAGGSDPRPCAGQSVAQVTSLVTAGFGGMKSCSVGYAGFGRNTCGEEQITAIDFSTSTSSNLDRIHWLISAVISSPRHFQRSFHFVRESLRGTIAFRAKQYLFIVFFIGKHVCSLNRRDGDMQCRLLCD